MDNLAHNIEAVKNKIEDASGGASDSVTLIAVTKTVGVETVRAAVEMGLRNLGENRVQEQQAKALELENYDIFWNLIGSVQKNKIKYTKNHVNMIQSLDRLDLAQAMQDIYEKNDMVMQCLVQVNIGYESQKSGVFPENLMDFIKDLENYKNICIKGLMCIPPFSDDIYETSKFFVKMRDLYNSVIDMSFNHVDMQYLSMGMSGDFEAAIENGANMVRIGSAIFGQRL